MQVHRELGCGFLEAVYQEALSISFDDECIPYEREKFIDINFMGRILEKSYIADFFCYGEIILELKALSHIDKTHEAQLINYLKATKKRLGILVNFGSESLTYKRVINKFA